MNTDDYKKYNILENIFQKINQKYVALPNDETKRNNKLLQVIDRIIQTLQNKSTLFTNLYQNKFYGGSFYDGLKVGKPSEYDLDCLLCLPKIVEPTVKVSDKPGYVHIVLNNMEALRKSEIEGPKYVGLDNLLVGNRLSTQKVRSWMESLMTSAVIGNSTMEIKMDDSDSKCVVKYKVFKSGPALTLKLEGNLNGQDFKIDIDLVPCFTFFDDHWPGNEYRPNPSQKKNTFFVVPKSPSEDAPLHWRLSFQEQERELLSGYAVMKPTIRLIKKLRDRHEHKIASYYIKTVFLWELEMLDKNFWNKPLSFVFVTMLRKYAEYIERKNIPYYWNDSNNLLGDLNEITASCIANKLKNIVDHIDKICNSKLGFYDVVTYFLRSEEVNMDTFKAEVPLQKKLMKQMEAAKLLESPPQAQTPQLTAKPQEHVLPTSASATSSRSSSFEDISKAMVSELAKPSFSQDCSKMLVRVEAQLIMVASEQKRIFGLMETILDKVERCESQLQELKTEVNKKAIEDIVRMHTLENKITEMGKKIDNAKNEAPSVDDLLGLTHRLTSSLNFQP
ncbi:hypothetical protein Zmor_005242 [Zophobas morio]|uniref:Uncharacterized protein n=1 Tax=Zophobas morio TaxID=2755281 RepID=A0AA38ISK9_9CUCU|nr:hypothetical protein Zmor_005242 [Zophobas morio]